MRTRDLRPGFFKNEQLARCDVYARILFEALWCLADREGRLEDRPGKIRAEAFPYEAELDADALLWQLHAAGLALRYVASDGRALIELPTFARHQNPYRHEKPSELPALGDAGSALRPPNNPDINGTAHFGDSTAQKATGADHFALSPFPFPPSPVLFHVPPGGGNAEGHVKQLALEGISPPLKSALKEKTKSKSKSKSEIPQQIARACPHELIRRLWCETLPTLPAPCEPWRESHARYLRARWREEALEHEWHSADEGLRWFRALFRYVGRSRFLTGHLGPRPLHAAPFEVTLEWLVKLEHWIKVQQGQYHDGKVQR
jgi:hypothetical protein